MNPENEGSTPPKSREGSEQFTVDAITNKQTVSERHRKVPEFRTIAVFQHWVIQGHDVLCPDPPK
jgi:hypothetical protein